MPPPTSTPHHPPPRLLAVLTALLLVMAAAADVHAQCQTRPDGTLWCDDGGGPGGDNLPGIGVSPPGLRTSQPATLPVTVTGADDRGIVDSTFHVYVNGADVTSTFSFSKTGYESGPIRVRFTATGSVRLSETGPTEVWARVCDTAQQCEVADPQRYVLVLPAVAVSPDGDAVVAVAGAGTQTFQVRNTGTEPAAFQLAAGCRDLQTGVAVACAAPQATAELGPGSAQTVQVSYTAAVGQELAVALTARQADAAGVQDAGWVDVAAGGPAGTAHAAAQITLVNLQSTGSLDRGDCVAVAVAVRAAYECGDLRLAHTLPAHRTRGRTWVPSLLYNSRHAHPHPTVYADVSLPAGAAVPSYVEAVISVPGGAYSAHFAGGAFAPGVTRRIGVQWEGLSTPTGLYRYTLRVTAFYPAAGGGTVPGPAVADSGEIAIVNRSQSPFGAGWWWAGWEQVMCVTCGTPGAPPRMLWIGGDGSTQLFEPLQTWASWTARTPDGAPDTLYLVPDGGGSSYYRRPLGGGGEIHLDGTGRHFRTLNRLGQTTWFDHSGGRLHGVYAPNTANGIAPAWLLNYDGAGRLATVNAASQGAVPRIVTLTNPDGRVTAIRGPDEHGVTFAYDPQRPNRVAEQTDRRDTRASFGYDAAGRLSSARVWMGTAPNDSADLIARFEPAESRGVVIVGNTGSSAARAHAYTRVDGPRTDAADLTRLHLDGQGRVRRAVNALGQATVARRTDARFPALVTESIGPAGQVTTAVYDALGRVSSTTTADPYGTGWNATTEYTWDDRWHLPRTTRTFADSAAVRRQIGGTGHTEYDPATGNPLWQRTGDDDARRVRYRYYPAGHPHAGQLRAVQAPATAAGSAVDSLVYDGVGNLSMTVSPLGFLTLHHRDALGRDTLVITPIDSAAATTPDSLRARGARQRIVYDVMDRVRRTESIGPPRFHAAVNQGFAPAPSPEERLEVVTEYDEEGMPRWVGRYSVPDYHGGGLVTEYTYDPAGRMVTDSSGQAGLRRFTRDQAGNVTVARTAAGFEVRMRYDALGRLTRRTVPERTWPSACDAVLLISGCETFPRFPNYGTGYRVPEEWHHYRYDANGQQAYAENADAIVTRTYTPGGALRTDSTWIRAAEGAAYAAYGLRYTYDPAGRLTALEHPQNLSATARPDNFSYHPVTSALSRAVSRLGHAFDFHQANDGTLISIRMPGAIADSMRYDREGRLVWRHESGPQAGVLHAETMRYDARGKLVHVVDGGLDPRDASDQGLSAFHNWYSGLGTLAGNDWYNLSESVARIAEELQTDPLASTALRRTSLERDPSGEFTRWENGFETGTGRLLFSRRKPPITPSSNFVQDSTSRHYDAGGNVIRGYQRVASPQDGIVVISREVDSRSWYGADDRLRAFQKMDVRRTGHEIHEDAGVWEEYRYDPLGRRVMVRTRTDGDLCNHDAWACTASTTTFVWAGDQLLWELKSVSGTYASAAGGSVAYFHAGGIDRPLVITKNGESIIPHQNWRDQFARGTYADGARAGQRSDCTSYPASGCTPIQWPGERTTAYHELEPEGEIRNWFGGLVDDMRDATGQMYRRNRYYDPQTGQFTQPDPIGLAGGLNEYGFAEGDPVSYDDPYGLTPCWILDRTQCDYTFLASVLGRSVAETQFIFQNPLTARRAMRIVDRMQGQVHRFVAIGRIPGGERGMHNGPGDAVRHAAASCQMTRDLGLETATIVGNNHEQDDSPDREKQMDRHNNAVGRGLASRKGTCINNAVRAWDRGELILPAPDPAAPQSPFTGVQ